MMRFSLALGLQAEDKTTSSSCGAGTVSGTCSPAPAGGTPENRASRRSAPSSAQAVQAFEDEGLTVVDPRPVEDGDLGMTPQTFEEVTHFVASAEEDLGTKVFTYESEKDLQKMRDFYEGFSGMLTSHVYAHDLMLVQINGQLPKAEADRYGEVLERM